MDLNFGRAEVKIFRSNGMSSIIGILSLLLKLRFVSKRVVNFKKLNKIHTGVVVRDSIDFQNYRSKSMTGIKCYGILVFTLDDT